MQYGQTKPGLNFEQIRKFKIPLPSLELQRTFATRIAAVERLKETHRKHLAELDALFASLQHRAFKGEL
jgi:type I restriction enzyme S subunit